MTDSRPSLRSLQRRASTCRACRLGTLQVSCPKTDKSGKACSICEGTGLKDHRNSVVCGEGRADSPIMLIGEGPGYHEDLMARPFFPEAPAGRVLRGLLGELGMSKMVWISNLVKCRPPDNKLSPYPDAVMECRKWLDQEISIIRPKVIVMLGAMPAARWFGGLPAHEVSGLARATGDGTIIVGAYHPAYAARGVDPEARPSIKRSLIRARELVKEVKN